MRVVAPLRSCVFSWVAGMGSSGRFGKNFFWYSTVRRKGEMLPVFRFDLFRGVLSILLCVFGVRYGVSLAMNFREFFRRFGNVSSCFSSINCWEKCSSLLPASSSSGALLV